jgi:HAD superfamily hydrolase (TIGR01662 family)
MPPQITNASPSQRTPNSTRLVDQLDIYEVNCTSTNKPNLLDTTDANLIIFDLGNTLVHQQIDSTFTLDTLDLKLFPKVKSTVKLLASKYTLAILSNTEQSRGLHVRRALKRLKISTYFDTILTSVDAGYRKPDPRIFYQLLQMTSTCPSRAIMIGNDIEADILGAKSAGIRTVFFSLLKSDWLQKDRLGILPDYETDEFEKIPTLLTL